MPENKCIYYCTSYLYPLLSIDPVALFGRKAY